MKLTRSQKKANEKAAKLAKLEDYANHCMDEAEKSGFDPIEVSINSRSRAHAHPGSSTIHVQMVGDRNSGRLLGAQLVGAEGVVHRINAVAVALHQKMTSKI